MQETYSLYLDVYFPDSIRNEAAEYNFNYSREDGTMPQLYLVMYGPVLSHRRISNYSEVTTNPFWLYANWPYHYIARSEANDCHTMNYGSWNTGDLTARLSFFVPFAIPEEIPSYADIPIDPAGGHPLYATILWVVYDDFIDSSSQHKPRALAIKLSTFEVTDDTGNFYNSSFGGALMPSDPDYESFYSSFTQLPCTW